MAHKRKDASLNKYVYITLVLLILNFSVSLLVVYYRHLNILSMSELQSLVGKQDDLHQEWTQLLLEQSTLVSYTRVDKIARNYLQMQQPNWQAVKIIRLETHDGKN